MTAARFVSCNLLHGRSLSDGLVDTDRMVRALIDLAPDVLAMQEVDHHQTRSADVDQTTAIATAMGDVSWRFVPSLIGEPGGVWRPATDADGAAGQDAPGGPGAGVDMPVLAPVAAYGTGLVVRWPVRSWHVVRVHPFPTRAPVYIPGAPRGQRFMLIHDEPRVCVAAVVDAPWGVMTVAAVHLSFVPGWNAGQLRRVGRALRLLPGPRLLLGDMNMPWRTPAMVSRWRSLAVGLPSFPAPAPRLQLDHALLDDPEGCIVGGASAGASRASGSGSVAAEVRALAFSDHRALIVDVRD